MDAKERFLLGTEIHSVDEINAAFSAGLGPNEPIDGTTPFVWLTEMYMRSSRFSDCVRAVIDAGADCDDEVLLAVLLNDSRRLRELLQADPSHLTRTVDMTSTFTPLHGATFLHVAAEYGLVSAASHFAGAWSRSRCHRGEGRTWVQRTYADFSYRARAV